MHAKYRGQWLCLHDEHLCFLRVKWLTPHVKSIFVTGFPANIEDGYLSGNGMVYCSYYPDTIN